MSGIPTHSIARRGALHFVAGLLDAALAPISEGGLTTEERERSAAMMSRISMVREKAAAMEPKADNIKDVKRVRRAILRMNDAIWDSWGERVDAREAVTAAMTMVAKQQEELDRLWHEGVVTGPKALEKRLEWGHLHTLLMELLELLDPDLESKPIDAGDSVGERMAAALHGTAL